MFQLSGIVFNVTRYMDFHPGGISELMRGVGKAATKLFESVSPINIQFINDQRDDPSYDRLFYFYVPIDRPLQVHAWVNYQSILQKCVVGRLSRGSITGSSSSSMENPASATTNCSSTAQNLITTNCTSE